jgi:hypothetical protein
MLDIVFLPFYVFRWRNREAEEREGTGKGRHTDGQKSRSSSPLVCHCVAGDSLIDFGCFRFRTIPGGRFNRAEYYIQAAGLRCTAYHLSTGRPSHNAKCLPCPFR